MRKKELTSSRANASLQNERDPNRMIVRKVLQSDGKYINLTESTSV